MRILSALALLTLAACTNVQPEPEPVQGEAGPMGPRGARGPAGIATVERAERTLVKEVGTIMPGELVAVRATCPEDMCIAYGGCSWGGIYNAALGVASMPELVNEEHVTTWVCTAQLPEGAPDPSSITTLAVCTSCDGEETLTLADDYD